MVKSVANKQQSQTSKKHMLRCCLTLYITVDGIWRDKPVFHGNTLKIKGFSVMVR